jgi:short-subunit dehydrogenase
LPIKVSAVCPDGIDTDMVSSQRDNPQAGLVFATRKLLTAEEVAGVVLDLVDKPRLAVSVPRSRAALAHAMRPFPAMSLKILKPFHQFGERQRRKSNGDS